MLAKTPGIVIRNTKYGEGSVISKIYTREFGMQSYMINGVQSPKASIKASLLQPLMMLDLVVYQNTLKDIQRIKEAKSNPQLHNLHFDIVKSSIGMFVSELLNKAIKEEEPNNQLYDFVADFIIKLDAETEGLGLWPLYFMLQLTNFLGFYPSNNFNENDSPYFDLTEGNFTSNPLQIAYSFGVPESGYFSNLMNIEWENLDTIQIPKPIRTILIQKLVLYYKLHLPDFQDIKSLEVLVGMG